MKNTLLILAALIFLFSTGKAQTATNFISKDCQGRTHELFAELDAGKVIVICWVMPCLPCVSPTLTTYKIVENYQAGNPGRVLFYLADDDGGTTCSELNAWANKYKIYETGFTARFSDEKINMLDYGSAGMPKIVVVASQSHKVFYNANDEVNANDLQNAINVALAVTSVNDYQDSETEIKVFPNPASKALNINIKTNKASQFIINITDILGRNISTSFQAALQTGENNLIQDVAGYKPGQYILMIYDKEKRVHFSRLITIN